MTSYDVDIPGEELIRSAVAELYGEDRDLLEIPLGVDRRTAVVRANERAIAARLAIHIDRHLARRSDYVVDVEYCRTSLGIQQKLGPGDRVIYPDLIIHRRGDTSPGSNAVVIEVKRGLTGGVDARDRAKVELLTSGGWACQAPYRLGLLLQLGEREARLTWVRDGALSYVEGVAALTSSHRGWPVGGAA